VHAFLGLDDSLLSEDKYPLFLGTVRKAQAALRQRSALTSVEHPAGSS
jgi:hypothetical protein